jgi:two-component system alkaline phosphatase synthesis response regulator PhoP
MSLRILLVEDESSLALTLSDLLTAEGYAVEIAGDGDAAFTRLSQADFDLILLDVMLPKKNGFDVCRDLRDKRNEIPILMLTARGQVSDRVTGLKIGADDYMAKPFDPAELLARVEALLRRVDKTARAPLANFQFDDVEIDFEHSLLVKSGQRINVTGKELQLLQYLITHRGRVVPREEILRNVWGYKGAVSSRTLDVHLAWLRQKLEQDPQRPKYLHTIRGTGYRFSA